MAAQKPRRAFLVTLLGAVLMIVNASLIIINKAPIVVSSSPIPETQETLVANNAPSWWRISFGFRGAVEDPFGYVWLAFAIIVLISALLLHFKPIRRKVLGLTILVSSVLTLPAGGGFLIGLILAIVGGGIAFEWPKPAGQTFLGKLLRAGRIDRDVFSSVAADPKVLRQAVLVIILVGILSSFGISLYSFNADKMLAQGTTAIEAVEILLGRLSWNTSILGLPILNVGVAVIQWIILSAILYVVGVKIIGSKAELEQISRAVAFAFFPLSLQFFMPFVFTSKPYLTTWPLMLFLITYLWMIIALVIAVKQSFEISFSKSVGTVFLGGSLYWLVNYVLFVKGFGNSSIVGQSVPVFPIPMLPGSIQILVQPPELALFSISVFIALATALGVFSKR